MTAKTYIEPQTTVPVYDECDVLVVGGGAAGHSAAIAAARAGCKNVVLMERYGYFGGDVTGGYVIMLPNLSWYDKSFIRGLQEEWFTRLAKYPGTVRAPGLDEIGSTDPVLVHAYSGLHDAVSRATFEGCKTPQLVRSVYFEPNYLKIEMDKMLLEHSDSIRVLCHSWGTKPIVENDKCTGVVFESKEGRKAVLAKVVIDATGDGDLFTRSGAPYQTLADGETRSSTTALVYRVAGIDWDAFIEWSERNPKLRMAFGAGLQKLVGFRIAPIPTNSNNMCWMNNWHAARDCAKIEDQTYTELHTRATIHDAIDYMRKACPAFRDAYLYDIAPQLGTRCSKRLTG